MAKRKKGEASGAPEKKSRLAAISAIVGLIGAAAVAILNVENVRNRFFAGPIQVSAAPMTCARHELTVPLSNNGRRAVTISSVTMSVLRNGAGDPHNIKVTAAPETIKAGESANVKLTASSADIGMDFPVSAGDRCRLEITFHLISEEKTTTVATSCECPS